MFSFASLSCCYFLQKQFDYTSFQLWNRVHMVALQVNTWKQIFTIKQSIHDLMLKREISVLMKQTIAYQVSWLCNLVQLVTDYISHIEAAVF